VALLSAERLRRNSTQASLSRTVKIDMAANAIGHLLTAVETCAKSVNALVW
jgi:hypothetical protein